MEKIYGPLIALKKKIDASSHSGYGFLTPRNGMEKRMLEKIIFHYYHLVDDDLKEDIFLIHPELSKLDTNKIKSVQLKIEDKILKHYMKNKKILGLV